MSNEMEIMETDESILRSLGFEPGECLLDQYTEWRNWQTGVCLEEDSGKTFRWRIYRYTNGVDCPDLIRKANATRLLERARWFKTARAALEAGKIKWPGVIIPR